MTVNNDTPPRGAGFNVLRAILGVLNSIFNLVLPKPKKLVVQSEVAEKQKPIAPAIPSQALSASEPASDGTKGSTQATTTGTTAASGEQEGGSAPHGHPAPALKQGWVLPKPEHIPAPTYWPVVMAAGITLLAFGVVTSLIVSGVGVFLFIIALVGWIGDIRNEQRENHKH